jgi:hypothetical protein
VPLFRQGGRGTVQGGMLGPALPAWGYRQEHVRCVFARAAWCVGASGSGWSWFRFEGRRAGQGIRAQEVPEDLDQGLVQGLV